MEEMKNNARKAMQTLRNEVYTELVDRFRCADDPHTELNKMIDDTLDDLREYSALPHLIWKLIGLFSCVEVIFKSLGYADAFRDLGATSITQEHCSTQITEEVCLLLLNLCTTSLDEKEENENE